MPVDTAHLKRSWNGRVRYEETIPDPALGRASREPVALVAAKKPLKGRHGCVDDVEQRRR